MSLASSTTSVARNDWHLLPFALLYCVLTISSLHLSQQPGSLIYPMFANSLAIAWLARHGRYWKLMFCIVVCEGITRLTFGQTWQIIALLTSINFVQIVMAAFLARQWQDEIEHNLRQLICFMLAVCCLPPLLGASAASGGLYWLTDANPVRAWSAWYAGYCISTLALLPLFTLLAQRGLNALLEKIHPRQFFPLALLVAMLTIIAEIHLPYPFAYLTIALISVALFLPFFQVSALVGLTSWLTLELLAHGDFVPPPMTSYWQALVLFLPLFLTQIPPLILACSMHQTRQREQARIAYATAAARATADKLQIYNNLLEQQRARKGEAEKMQAILTHAADAIITTDDSGIIESFNRAAEKIYLCDAEQAIGQNMQRFIGESAPAARRNAEGYVEQDHRRSDGHTFPAELLISEYMDGERRKWITIVRDVSERRRIERIKNDFVSTVSHELRTPLTSIRGALGLVVGGALGPLPAQQKKLLDTAKLNSERLTHLINDLLDMQKMEAGKLEFQFESYALEQVLHDAMEANQGYASQYQVKLRIQAKLPKVQIWVDFGRMIQILSNLLSNACKFSSAGQQVELHARLLDEKTVRITVTDHGSGIAPEFSSRIFQKFSQSDSSDTKSKGGTGLGLSIAHSIASHMGASLHYDSQTGVGSNFHLDLPIHQADG